MIPVMCIVQEGQISSQVEAKLRTDLISFALRVFGAAPEIDWIVVPAGSGFTAAKPSRSVIASMQGNRRLDRDDRASLLRELADIFMSRTGRLPHEIVTSIRDPQ